MAIAAISASPTPPATSTASRSRSPPTSSASPLAELANISERRTQMLLDSDHNRGLPSNLTTRPGVNSGLMITQYTAASLVSENKVLAHPASVDSIPTGANAEDHVSMSTHAARKMRTILGNVAERPRHRADRRRASDRVARGDDAKASPRRTPSPDAETQAAAFEAAVSGRAAEIARFLGHGTARALSPHPRPRRSALRRPPAQRSHPPRAARHLPVINHARPRPRRRHRRSRATSSAPPPRAPAVRAGRT